MSDCYTETERAGSGMGGDVLRVYGYDAFLASCVTSGFSLGNSFKLRNGNKRTLLKRLIRRGRDAEWYRIRRTAHSILYSAVRLATN